MSCVTIALSWYMPVDRVADARVGVEAQREALEAVEQREAQVLVHALQDPDLVVVERHHERRRPRCRRATPTTITRAQQLAAQLRRRAPPAATKRAGSRPSRRGLEGQQRLALERARPEAVEEQHAERERRASARPAKAPNSAATWRRTGRSSAHAAQQQRRSPARKRRRSSRPPVPRAARCARASSAAWLIRGSGRLVHAEAERVRPASGSGCGFEL